MLRTEPAGHPNGRVIPGRADHGSVSECPSLAHGGSPADDSRWHPNHRSNGPDGPRDTPRFS